MTMETLSKWKIKPYIDLYLWELFYKVEFPLIGYGDLFTLMDFNRHSVHLEADDKEYIISRKDFDEVMYQVEDAPKVVI